jgi:hypothetical protein
MKGLADLPFLHLDFLGDESLFKGRDTLDGIVACQSDG